MDIKDILQECFSENLNDYKNNLFLFVRDIPYEINDACSPKLLLKIWKWYCVPKHRLLKILFDQIGVQSKFVLSLLNLIKSIFLLTYKIGDLLINFDIMFFSKFWLKIHI